MNIISMGIDICEVICCVVMSLQLERCWFLCTLLTFESRQNDKAQVSRDPAFARVSLDARWPSIFSMAADLGETWNLQKYKNLLSKFLTVALQVSRGRGGKYKCYNTQNDLKYTKMSTTILEVN